MKVRFPRLIITPGEPAGIGPDITLMIAKEAFPAELVVCADKTLLATRAKQLGLKINLATIDGSKPLSRHQPNTLNILHVPAKNVTCCGIPDKANASYVINTLQLATQKCLEHQFDGLVTGPVNKAIINEANISFQGHTELLAELTQTDDVVMMLATEGLRVALVTTHVQLSKVSSLITRARLRKTLNVLFDSFARWFGIENPNILVCGLNPHAGEQGILGNEEVEIINPVIQEFVLQGRNIKGALSADTLFTAKYLDNADVVLAMYHDQGLPVLKYKGFGQAVNVTLGLPIIRTSVDHGTAFELAGTSKASPNSLLLAIETAIDMANNDRDKG